MVVGRLSRRSGRRQPRHATSLVERAARVSAARTFGVNSIATVRASRRRRPRLRDQPPGQLQPARRGRRPPCGRRVDTSEARRRQLSRQKKALAGEKQKPSNGLEPLTPSLPYARAPTATKVPQTGRIRRRDLTRTWTRVVGLVFPPCSLGEG